METKQGLSFLDSKGDFDFPGAAREICCLFEFLTFHAEKLLWSSNKYKASIRNVRGMHCS
jgi:hypothetical protein